MKPRARTESGVWLVWCEDIGPSPRGSFIGAYEAWLKRRVTFWARKNLLSSEVGS